MFAKLRRNPNKLNLYLDLAIVLAFAVEMEEHFTGLHNHELLGLAFGLAVLLHIVLHWNWVVSITKHLFSKLFHESRLNYALNLALYIDMVIVIVSGILISRTIGLSLPHLEQVEPIHRLASEVILVLVGLHVALHWKWIVTHTGKYLVPSRLWKPVVMTPTRPITQEGQS
jgi:hypothetical protein